MPIVHIEERANDAINDDGASSVELIEPLWADVQRIEAEINATDGDPDEALEKRFSEAEERLWMRSRHAFNARVGRSRQFLPFACTRKRLSPMEVVH